MKVSKSVLFLALASISGAAMAANDKMVTPDSFVGDAAQAGMTEVALGKLALSRSHDDEVQKFAQRMVTDHEKANSELMALAKAKGLTAPSKLDASHEAMVEQMESQDGAAFDQAYSRHMKMDHSKAIDLFENAAASGDADVAGFARKTLPTLKEHKMMADKLPSRQ